MPSFAEIAKAAVSIADDIGDCSFEKFHWAVKNAVRSPQDWGFPARYAGGMNWNVRTLAPEVAGVIWRKPTHPSRIPKPWRALPFATLVKLIWDGRTPTDLWLSAVRWGNDTPSKAEVNEWLEQIAINRKYGGEEWETWLSSPIAWIIRHLPAGTVEPREMAIARWMAAKKDWKGWTQPVEIGYGADGVMQTAQFNTLVDEIDTGDLVNGVKTNPATVLRRILSRKSEEELRKAAERNAPFPKLPWGTIPGVTHINCEQALVDEGRRMHHCAGTYGDRCREGRTYILRLPRSTAEVLPDGRVYQHRGPSNSDPSPSDIALLKRWHDTCVNSTK